jgi:uncharacterized metal-binding protein
MTLHPEIASQLAKERIAELHRIAAADRLAHSSPARKVAAGRRASPVARVRLMAIRLLASLR